MKIRYKNEKQILELKEDRGVPYFSYPMLENTEVVYHGFSTRLGGVSTGHCSTMNISSQRGDDPEAVRENKKRLAKAIGVRHENLVLTDQIHSTNVAVVTENDRGRCIPETDGLITDVPGLCLVTFFADCVPLYFVDPVKKAIGLSHSGWRGTVAKMANVTIKKMTETFGTNPKDVIAAIGPSICQDCYEVSEDVILKFQENYDRNDWESLYYCKPNGKYQLNLWKANEINFREAGILQEHIAVTNVCTCCNPELLFSHRVTGTARGNVSALLALKE